MDPLYWTGGGGSASILDVSISTPEASQTETDVKFVAAWQAMAGIRYRFTENFGLGFVYKYFGTEAPNFDILGVELELDPVHNHYFGLQLNYNY